MLLLHTDSLGQYGLHRIFEFAKKAGFDGVELAISDKKFDTQDAEYLKKIVEETGTQIKAVQTLPDADKDKIKMAYDIAEAVNADTITILPPAFFSWKAISWIKENVPKLRSVSKRNITVINTPDQRTMGLIPKAAFNSLKDLHDFKEMTLDTSNLFSRNLEITEVYRKLKQEIRHVHLSNYRGEKDHCLPNEGRIPLESLLKKMWKDEFNGHFSLKVYPAELYAGKSDEKVLEQLKKAKDFYTEYFS